MTMQPLNRLQIAWRAAQDIRDGMLVNLGLGMPVAVADYIRPEVDVFIQSENGVIGVGPLAAPEHVDTDLVDAGSRRVTIRSGASIVDSSWSFAMIRGGHVDVAILGASRSVTTLSSSAARLSTMGSMALLMVDASTFVTVVVVVFSGGIEGGGAWPDAIPKIQKMHTHALE